MVRRTCTAIAVLVQADTQVSPIGVTWGSAALGPCSLRIGSQEPSVRHGPIVPRCPGNGPETPSLIESKGRKHGGRHKTRTRGEALHTGLLSDSYAPPTHSAHDPGRAPRRHPHLRRDPLNYEFRISRTVSKRGGFLTKTSPNDLFKHVDKLKL